MPKVSVEDRHREIYNLNKINRNCPYIISCISFYAWISDEDEADPLKLRLIFPLAENDLDTMRK